MFTRRNMVGLLALSLLALGAPTTALAQGDRVTLKVSVVHAKKTGNSVDPALNNIRGSLKKAFGGYSSFTQLTKKELTLAGTKPVSLKLPNGKTAVFTHKGKSGKQHQLKLTIPQSKVNVDLTAPAKRLFYQAGLRHDGGILILAMYLKE